MTKNKSEEKTDNRLDQKELKLSGVRNNKDQAEISQEGNKAEVSLMEEREHYLLCTSVQWVFLY